MFCPYFRSEDEDAPPKGKVQRLVSMCLQDAEFCREEQETFTPDMLDVAAECAKFLWETLDPRLRKVSEKVLYDFSPLQFLHTVDF